MAGNKSSAKDKEIMPQGKPSSSFINNTDKTGEFGDMPIQGKMMAGDESTEKANMSEDFGKKPSVSFDGISEATPEGKPASTFINTSALKKG